MREIERNANKAGLMMFEHIPQITNITDLLPSHIAAEFDRSQEVLECIVVHQNADHAFIGASRNCGRDYVVSSFCFSVINDC